MITILILKFQFHLHPRCAEFLRKIKIKSEPGQEGEIPTMEKTIANLVQTLANESKTSGSDMIEIMKIFASSTQSSNQSSLKIQEYQLQ